MFEEIPTRHQLVQSDARDLSFLDVGRFIWLSLHHLIGRLSATTKPRVKWGTLKIMTGLLSN